MAVTHVSGPRVDPAADRGTGLVISAGAEDEGIATLERAFAAHRQAYLAHPFPELKERRRHLYALAGMLLANREPIREALRSDFAAHHDAAADIVEIAGPLNRALYAAKHLKAWMAPERRPVDPLSFGLSKAQITWQPKGVTGNIVPWNFPFDIAFGPLVDMLAAGNRVIIKTSEYTPASGALVAELVAKTYAADHVTVVTGGIAVGERFAQLPWDHLLFTGSPEIGQSVAAAAAANLTPVTLELGGKNPTIFADDVFADDAALARHLHWALGVKLVKSGQMCISLDHCYVPRRRLEQFVQVARTVTENAGLADHASSDSATGIISARHFDRQLALLAEARDAGATVVQLDERGAHDPDRRRLPLTLVVDPPPGLRLMREEVFGPILPVVPYDSIDELLHTIRSGDRPLGLYLFTADDALVTSVQRETASGGMCVNFAAAQGAIPSLGFGGSGRSGYGRHHGIDGFREFSNPRGTFTLGAGASGLNAFLPPYGPGKQRQIDQLFALRGLQLRLGKTLRR